MLNVAQHPGRNVSALFHVPSGMPAFQPSLSGAPNDWTLSLEYSGGGLSTPQLPAVDAQGNVWVGRRRECATLAHASRRLLVTVERVVPGNLLEDERLAPGTISAAYIEQVAVAEHGAWPVALLNEYPADAAHVGEYARAARTAEGFRGYLRRHVTPAAAA